MASERRRFIRPDGAGYWLPVETPLHDGNGDRRLPIPVSCVARGAKELDLLELALDGFLGVRGAFTGTVAGTGTVAVRRTGAVGRPTRRLGRLVGGRPDTLH